MKLIFYWKRQTINKCNNFKSDKCPERHWAECCNNDLQLRVNTIGSSLRDQNGEELAVTALGQALKAGRRAGPGPKETNLQDPGRKGR